MSRRRHRGPHPEDARAFGKEAVPRLEAATHDACWLMSRGYAGKALTALVGDRYQLTDRQRRAVMRCACSDRARDRRRDRRVALDRARGATLRVDGFNVLLTVESALAGGLVLLGRDGCLRDMASLNGRFEQTRETAEALDAIGATLEAVAPARAVWLFDRPVPFSGRIAAEVEATAEARGWPWTAETVANPDPILKAADDLVATADGAILEAAPGWVNLARAVVEARIPRPWVLALTGESPGASGGSNEAECHE